MKSKRYSFSHLAFILSLAFFFSSSDVFAESLPIQEYNKHIELPFELLDNPFIKTTKIEIFDNFEDNYKWCLDHIENDSFSKILDEQHVSNSYGNHDDLYLCGYHLGADYKAISGTPIYAPGNGYVYFANGSYSNDGYIGCETDIGLNLGGNQIFFITEVDNTVYGIIFLHLDDVFVENKNIVMAGDVIGTTGGSGSVDAPHLHVEIYALGEGDLSNYVFNEYDYSFNVPRRYINSYDYPYRTNPEFYWN